MLSRFVREVGQSFRRNEGGNVAMMTAIALVFIVGAVAVSLDMSKGVSNKSRLSDTTDAIALFLAKSGFETQADLQRAATEYMAKSYPGEDGNFLKILSITKDGDAVTVKMADVSENSFGGIVDAEGEYVSVSATAVWSQRTMDMVLVLDTTLSMEGTRLTSLKRAATDMVNTIDKPGSDNFRISVVPFSEYVNVGLSRRYERWMAVPNDTSTTSNVCRKKRDVTSKSNCRTIRGTRDRDGVSVPHTYQKCDRTYGPEYEVCGPRTVSQKWYGCVGSRSEPYDLRADFQGRKIPGLLNERCGAEILEMTSSFAAARSTISNLSARGNTYMPSGLMWGWRALSGDAPLQHRIEPKTERVMVLMTDGENTRSKKDERHNGRDKTDADNKTREICNAIKSEDIIVYTIAYEVTDASTTSLLQNCASGNQRYFNARNAQQLERAFQDIADSLSDLRISA